jgi:hypothetical protein
MGEERMLQIWSSDISLFLLRRIDQNQDCYSMPLVRGSVHTSLIVGDVRYTCNQHVHKDAFHFDGVKDGALREASNPWRIMEGTRALLSVLTQRMLANLREFSAQGDTSAGRQGIY